jgi:acetyltransferase
MASGTELFAGVKFFPGFGYIILTGPGGILVEIMKDFSFGLVPLGMEEASDMIKSLRSYDIIKGTRGRKPVNERVLAALLCNLSELCQAAPEIKEMDLNPLICSEEEIFAADLRILVNKEK